MQEIRTKLAELLKNLDVTEDPRRMADGALLMAAAQEHERNGARLKAQIGEFIKGESPTALVDGHKPLADWAYEVLQDSPGPMPYREVAAEIRGRGFKHARQPKYGDAQLPDSVWSAMHEDPKKRFVKVGRGIWDLTERVVQNGS